MRPKDLRGGMLHFDQRWEIYLKTNCNAQCRERGRHTKGKTLVVAGPPDMLRDAEKMALDILLQLDPDCVKTEDGKDMTNRDRADNDGKPKAANRTNRWHGQKPQQAMQHQAMQHQAMPPGLYGYMGYQPQQPPRYGYDYCYQPQPSGYGYPMMQGQPQASPASAKPPGLHETHETHEGDAKKAKLDVEHMEAMRNEMKTMRNEVHEMMSAAASVQPIPVPAPSIKPTEAPELHAKGSGQTGQGEGKDKHREKRASADQGKDKGAGDAKAEQHEKQKTTGDVKKDKDKKKDKKEKKEKKDNNLIQHEAQGEGAPKEVEPPKKELPKHPKDKGRHRRPCKEFDVDDF